MLALPHSPTLERVLSQELEIIDLQCDIPLQQFPQEDCQDVSTENSEDTFAGPESELTSPRE